MVRQEGIEPPTYGLEDRCSNPLSYWRILVESFQELQAHNLSRRFPLLDLLSVLQFLENFVSGTPSGIRTRTEQILSLLTLPVGLWEQMVVAQGFEPCIPERDKIYSLA